MKQKTYISNICRQWTVEAQRKALAQIPKPVEAYEDVLKPRALKAHSPADLKARAELLRATGRRRSDETIYVASLGVLAWVAEDFMACMGAAAARHATVTALDTGHVVPPTATAADLAAALSEFLAERRRHQTTNGRLAGPFASKEARKADTRRRADLIEKDWHEPIVPTPELLLRAGRVPKGRRDVVPMAYRTAVNLLGRRPTQHKFDEARLKEKT